MALSFTWSDCAITRAYSIFINHANIDVNVHPTKHEVHFLHEDVIIDCIQKTIQEKLLSCDSSRTYYTQSLLPSASVQVSSSLQQRKRTLEEDKVYDYKLVRTDAKEKKLDAFTLPKTSAPESSLSPRRTRKLVHLTSVLSLQDGIKKNKHNGGYHILMMSCVGTYHMSM